MLQSFVDAAKEIKSPDNFDDITQQFNDISKIKDSLPTDDVSSNLEDYKGISKMMENPLDMFEINCTDFSDESDSFDGELLNNLCKTLNGDDGMKKLLDNFKNLLKEISNIFNSLNKKALDKELSKDTLDGAIDLVKKQLKKIFSLYILLI